MKKILALFIIAAMMILSVVPTSAEGYKPTVEPAPPAAPEGMSEELYQMHSSLAWENYKERTEELEKELPGISEQRCKTYAEYCAQFPAEGYALFAYLGTYGDGSVTLWLFSQDLTFGAHSAYVGEYCLDDTAFYTEDAPGLVVYVGGELVYLVDAYKQGIIDDADLDALYAAGYSVDNTPILRRMGDVDMSGVLDVGDIMSLKNLIMKNSTLSDGVPVCSDVDRNGTTDVGDIMALKDHIMKKP